MSTVLLVAAIAVAMLIQIFTDPRINKQFIALSLLIFSLYVFHVIIGILVMMVWMPWGPAAALGGTIAMLGWIGLGGLGLIRLSPRLREPHPLLLCVGVADVVCLLMVVGGIACAFGIV